MTDTESKPQTFLSNLKQCLKLNLLYFFCGFGLFILSLIYINIRPELNWAIIISLSVGTSLMVLSVITIINCMKRIKLHKNDNKPKLSHNAV